MTFLFKILKNIPRLILNILFVPVYHFCGIFPRNKNLWLFSSWMGKRYNDSSLIFFEYVQKNHPDIKTAWILKDKELIKKLRQKNINVVSSYSPKSIWLTFRAGKIFSTSADEFFLGFTKGCDFIELWHGMPLKKIGYDDKISKGNETFMHKISLALNKKCFPWRSFITLRNIRTLTNAEFFSPFLQSAFNISKDKILPVGLPRTDALFFHHKEKLLEKIKTDFPESKIILYMPTFRTGVWSKKPFNPFEEKYGFDSAEFSEFLEKQNLVFLYKPHFVDLELGQKEELGRRFIFISDESYDEQYNFIGQIDILMTDYSSIYFDFIATKKPVILAPFDLEEYIVTSRAHYFDYSELEGAKAKNWQEFYKILEENSYVPVLEETRKKFSEYVDGNACERLWKEITEK